MVIALKVKMMNKILKHSHSSKKFKVLIQYIFDDYQEIDEVYLEHDEVAVKAIAEVTLEIATDAIAEAEIEGMQPQELVGIWMMEGSRSSSNGFYWDLVDEIVKVEEVTETKIVTYWKPICDENSTTSSESVKPCSKK